MGGFEYLASDHGTFCGKLYTKVHISRITKQIGKDWTIKGYLNLGGASCANNLELSRQHGDVRVKKDSINFFPAL